jgi:peptide/nickel transport system permease protein
MRRAGPRFAALSLALLVLAALAAPWLAPSDPRTQLALDSLVWQPPSGAHPLGTDSAARDVLSRMLFGARSTLGIATLAMLVAITLGTLVGTTAAVARGRVDALLMRFTDTGLALPRLLLLLLVVATFGHPGDALFAVIPGRDRLDDHEPTRAAGDAAARVDHMRGARAMGVPPGRIVRRHLLPALAPTIAVAATFAFAAAVPLEAGLSFLGLGVETPTPSWGNILTEADSRPLQHWWLILLPTLAIVDTVIDANAIAEAIARDARDGLTAAREERA